MASRAVVRYCLLRASYVKRDTRRAHQCRNLSVTTSRRTDGVFRELTDQRVQTPWIEAFRKRQKEGPSAAAQGKGKPQTPKDRDLTPKKMSDSYHSVVRTSQWTTFASSLTDT